jgi:16S rRNA (adenine1518-N6/adenine1519-N6)-dimethyltransferase
MNLPPLNAASLLKEHGLHAKKSLGQNFLSDPVVLERIAAAAEIPSDASVLEIGPGLGSLTRFLADQARRVVVVELDQNLIPLLSQVLTPFDNVSIVHGDILKVDPAELMQESGYLVVANIPYFITSAVIRHLLESKIRPGRIVLTIQREVAERIIAKQGSLSLLALSVQVYGAPSIAGHIPAGAFYPPPKVDSAIVRVELYDEPLIPSSKIDTFFRLAKAGFSQKRKTLRNSLAGGLALSHEQSQALLARAGIDSMRRAQTLTLDEWRKLVDAYLEE